MTELAKRRRALMAKLDNVDYITDGLSLHLDAIDNEATGTHNPNFLNWIDKVGQRVFTQYPNASQIQFSDKYFPANGTNYFSYPASGETIWNTIEITIETNSTATMAIFQSASTPNLGSVSVKSGNVLFAGGGSLSTSIRTGRHTYSCNGTNVYVDGMRVTPSGTTVSWTGVINAWKICTWKSNNYIFNGKIYAIRCYNRTLSDSEIAHNASIDSQRFS